MDKLSFSLPEFEGPLDLLLFLISKNKINIIDIPISSLLLQYIQYIETMREADLDVASEFLEMASRLVYIKSSMLLPKYEETEDPRSELAAALIEYSTCRNIAGKFREMSSGFNIFTREPLEIECDHTYHCIHQKEELFGAYLSATKRAGRKLPPPETAFTGIVSNKIVSVTSKIIFVLRKLLKNKHISMSKLFVSANGRSDLVAIFLAVLELIKAKRLEIDDATDILKMCDGGEKLWKLVK
jgi:segregation and condensation protein A